MDNPFGYTVAYRFNNGDTHETYLNFNSITEAKHYADNTINNDKDIETIVIDELDIVGDPSGTVAYRDQGKGWINW